LAGHQVEPLGAMRARWIRVLGPMNATVMRRNLSGYSRRSQNAGAPSFIHTIGAARSRRRTFSGEPVSSRGEMAAVRRDKDLSMGLRPLRSWKCSALSSRQNKPHPLSLRRFLHPARVSTLVPRPTDSARTRRKAALEECT